MFDLDEYARSFLLADPRQGMAVPFRYIFPREASINYPFAQAAKQAVPGRACTPNGEERCIACKLCEVVCPLVCIFIESEPREDGSRRTTNYDIDMTMCIYRGLCEEACPVGTIVMG